MQSSPLKWRAALCCLAASLLVPACSHASADTSSQDTSLFSRIFTHKPAYHDVTVPAGTIVPVTLDVALASNANEAEDPVRATVSHAVVVDGVTTIPAGSVLHGSVTDATPSGKVEGRARLAFRFDQLGIGHDSYDVTTRRMAYEARSTKTADAEKIGGGAAIGSLIGAIAGGGKGAAIGAAIGGGAGTAVVVSTPGDNVRLRSGAPLTVKLEAPLTVHVPNKT